MTLLFNLQQNYNNLKYMYLVEILILYKNNVITNYSKIFNAKKNSKKREDPRKSSVRIF